MGLGDCMSEGPKGQISEMNYGGQEGRKIKSHSKNETVHRLKRCF